MRIVCSLVSVTVIFQLEFFIILNVNYRNVCSSDRNSVYSPEAVSAPPGELILGTGKWTIIDIYESVQRVRFLMTPPPVGHSNYIVA